MNGALLCIKGILDPAITLRDSYQMINNQKIEMATYNPNWPTIFEQEALQLRQNLGDQLSGIHHIGSTSIPNMIAKPVIDILIECDNLDNINQIAAKLQELNYSAIRRSMIPHRSFLTSKYLDNIGFHLHLFERGDPQVKRHVNFRDYVANHPAIADEYAELKADLVKKFSDNRIAYVLGKEKLVQDIDAKAKIWTERKKDFLSPNTGVPYNHWSHEKIIKAMEANLNVHMTHFAQYLNQVTLIRKPGFTLVNSELPDDTFNFVLDADFTQQDANENILEVTRYFSETKTPFSWWINPHDNSINLAEKLSKMNYQNTDNNTAMYFDLDAWDGNIPFPSELQIVQAKDEKTLLDFAMVLVNDETSYKKYFLWVASVLTDEDPIEYYVGYVDGKPVVRGSSCYYAQIAGLHSLATSTYAHKKGYGKAMQEFRLKRAKELGYHVAVLQASSDRYPFYNKLDYKECGEFRVFKKISQK